MSTKLQTGQTLLFIGDSITDCGRRDNCAPLGCGYVKRFRDLLTVLEPQKKVNIINKGIGGDRAPGLRDRWSDDVLRHKPDWLSVLIGVNDLCHTLDGGAKVTPELFEEAYDGFLSLTKAKLPRTQILLLDPFLICLPSTPSSKRQVMLDHLPKYIRVVHKMARQYKTRHIKTHEQFQALLKHHETDTFCPEPVHPNDTGHLALAEWIYADLSK